MERVHWSTHHTIVVVDVEAFGERRRTNPHQRGIRDGLYHVMQTAFDMIDVPWSSCYHEDRGDAIFVLAPSSTPKAVFVETLPTALIKLLHAHNDMHPDAQRIRLRMAVHAGEVLRDDHGVTSNALVTAFRLIDAKQLKSALAASPGVLAMITSSWFFEDVVRHCPGAAPHAYRAVQVSEKETTTVGWIALPDQPNPPAIEEIAADRRDNLVPRQLPLAVRDFTGRAEHLATLDALIPSSGERSQAVIITAIKGTAGIGKTTLAVHWAHRVQRRFPDGTLHADLRGYGPGIPAAPGEVLDGFLRALDTPARKVPEGVEAKAALFRSLVSGRQMLVVLDNANSADQVRPLLPGAGGCMVVVTSRDSLSGLAITEAAYRLTLDLLTPAEALDLVAGIIGVDRVAAEPDAVMELIRLCARLPLALRIAGSKVIAHSNNKVADVVAELCQEQGPLTPLSRSGDERTAVRAVFDWSYQLLTDDQARLFRHVGLHPGPDLSVGAAAAIAGLDVPVARELLEDLAGVHLIESAAPGRYRLHDLLRVYAAEQAQHCDPAADRDEALEAVVGWYARTARACDKTVYPEYPRLSLQSGEPEGPVPGFDRAEALAWLHAERSNLLAALRIAVCRKLHSHALQIANCMRFLYAAGRWDEAFQVVDLGLETAESCDDFVAECLFYCRRGSIFTELRRWDEAVRNLDQAMALACALGNRHWQAVALTDLGVVCNERDRFEEAMSLLRQALPLSRGADNGRMTAVIEGNLSRAFSGLGGFAEALEHGELGLELRRRIGDVDGEPCAIHNVAVAWQGLGDHVTAIRMCEEAIILGREIGNTAQFVAAALDTRAMSLHHIGKSADAAESWREAALLYDECGYPYRAEEVRRRLREVGANSAEGFGALDGGGDVVAGG